MDILQALHANNPLLWVVTDESARLVDLLVEELSPKSSIFRMDAFDGFVTYIRGAWKKVLVNLDGDLGPTFNFSVALHHVFSNSGVMLVEHAHKDIDKILPLASEVSRRYHLSVMNSKPEMVKGAFVLFSCMPTPPQEISRICTVIEHELPTDDDLRDLCGHFEDKGFKISSTNKVIGSGLGLSEMEFLTASWASIKEHGRVEDEYIDTYRRKLLHKGSLLEVRRPKFSLDDLGGLDNAKRIIQSISNIWSNAENYHNFDIVPLRRLLLVGIPGSGKSSIAEAAAHEMDLLLAKGGVSQMMSKWVGESEGNMRTMFRQLKAMAPIVFWIDEFGRDLSGDRGDVDGGTTMRTHGEFLTGMQELPENILVMAAANRIDHLPPEMLRAERIDKTLFFGFPTLGERMDIFRTYLSKDMSYDFEQLAAATPFFTGAEIKALVTEVKFDICSSLGKPRDITTADLMNRIPKMKNLVWLQRNTEMRAMYSRAVEEWEWASAAQEAEAHLVLSATSKSHSVKTAAGVK